MDAPLFILVSTIVAWLLAQTIKIWFHNGTPGEPWYWRAGGFPSSHTAPSTALSVSILLSQGFSSLFVFSLVFLVAIIRDALGVRYATGVNALVLKKSLKGKLADEVVIEKGHTPTEVLGGLLVGVLASLLVWVIF